MHYIVLDLEFNQDFDFEKNKTINSNPSCRFEIIQIGAVKLDENLYIIDKLNLYIKPNLYKTIHPYVEKITGITKDFLNDKPSFSEVIPIFAKFIENEDDCIFCVWGSSDLRALYRNLSYYNLLNKDLILKYIDIQNIATNYLKFNKGGFIGLKTAIESFNLPIKKEFHNALNDAIYTAEILKIVKSDNIIIKIFNSKYIPKK